MSQRPVIPPALQEVYDRWHYAPAMISGGHVFCSGIIGVGPGGEAPAAADLSATASAVSAAAPSGGLAALEAVRDPAAQFATAFDTLRAVLEEAGAGLGDVVEITTYHVGLRDHIATFMQVRDRYLAQPYPAWTAIGVAELLVPGGLVEIRAVARLPG